MSKTDVSGGDRPISELVNDATRQLRLLLRQEVSLARAEFGERATAASRGLTMVAAGVGIAYAGLLAIVAGLCLALSLLGLDVFLSALLVGAAFALLGYVMLRVGLARLRPAAFAPTATVETVQESVQTLRGQTVREAR